MGIRRLDTIDKGYLKDGVSKFNNHTTPSAFEFLNMSGFMEIILWPMKSVTQNLSGCQGQIRMLFMLACVFS